jgi:hypothetical protein
VVFEAYLDGSIGKGPAPRVRRGAGALSADEAAVLGLLQRRLARDVKRRAS